MENNEEVEKLKSEIFYLKSELSKKSVNGSLTNSIDEDTLKQMNAMHFTQMMAAYFVLNTKILVV